MRWGLPHVWLRTDTTSMLLFQVRGLCDGACSMYGFELEQSIHAPHLIACTMEKRWRKRKTKVGACRSLRTQPQEEASMHSHLLGEMDPTLNGLSYPGVICGEGTSFLSMGLVASALAAPPSRNYLGQNPNASNPLLV